jgi:hypothetical protein
VRLLDISIGQGHLSESRCNFAVLSFPDRHGCGKAHGRETNIILAMYEVDCDLSPLVEACMREFFYWLISTALLTYYSLFSQAKKSLSTALGRLA